MRNSPWQRANALYLEINGKSCWFFARIIYNRLFMHNHKYLYTICICICVLFSKRIALWLFLLSCVNLASRNVYKIVRIISIRWWDRVGVAFAMERVWMNALFRWMNTKLTREYYNLGVDEVRRWGLLTCKENAKEEAN